MTKTVIGTYSNIDDASQVVNRLVNAGFDRDDISIIANDSENRYSTALDSDETDDVAKGAGIGAAIGGIGGLLVGLGALAIPGIGPVIAAGPIAAALAGAGIGAVTGGMIGALVDMGIPEEEAHIYAESVRRGNVLVAARVSDGRADEAARIMQNAGLIDIKRQAEDWRASGWTGFRADDTNGYQATQRATSGNVAKPKGENVAYNQTTTGSTRKATNGQTGTRQIDKDETIEVVEEDIHVGKREVQGGGVRVSAHVREVPVEEEVRLREEHVQVERRPVNRPATAKDLDSFREGTIEVKEMREEAVVAKDARVVEEINIRKDVNERTEKVHDTVRRTEVEVEQLGNTRTATGQNSTYKAYDFYEPDFRTHFKTAYGRSGRNYDLYQPAYQYGYTWATDDRYSDRNWRDVEPELRRDWESRNQGPWEDFKDAVQHSWDKVRGRA